QPVALVRDERRRGHPVERLVAAGVIVDEHRAVALQDEQPHGLREDGRDPAGAVDLAAGDDETHAAQPTVPFGHVRATRYRRGLAAIPRGSGTHAGHPSASGWVRPTRSLPSPAKVCPPSSPTKGCFARAVLRVSGFRPPGKSFFSLAMTGQ